MTVEAPGYFTWKHYAFKRPPELDGVPVPEHEVIVVGAGPVGLATALSLGQQGIRVVLLEARDCVSENSRTLAVARRSVQVLERLGLGERFRQLAVYRDRNYVYHGTKLVHSAPYERSPTEKHPAISVLQQPWTEQIILDAVLEHPNIDVRWLSRVSEVVLESDGRPVLTVETPEGAYRLSAPYVVAADGARGMVRRSLGLKYEEIGEGVVSRNFVICDFEMKSSLPVARRLWINPPHRPGTAVILHKQPFDTWRFDYSLRDDEDLEEAMKPENVRRLVQAQLDLLADPTASKDWRLVWISAYRPMSRTLRCYRYGRIFFAGDAAHQTPIFGGRGMNQGLLDAANLAWKLALVLRGHAPDRLLDTYDSERRPVIIRNLLDIGQATLCMTATTRGGALMRKAAFDLLPTEKFTLRLIDAFNANRSESLLTPQPVETPDQGAVVGSPLPDAPVVRTGTAERGFLYDHLLAHGFTGLYFSDDGEVSTELAATLRELEQQPVPFRHVVVSREHARQATLTDADGIAFDKLKVGHGTWLLVRPDGYVAVRLEQPAPATLLNAWHHTLGVQ